MALHKWKLTFFIALFSQQLFPYPMRYRKLILPQTKRCIDIISDCHVMRQISSSENILWHKIQLRDRNCKFHTTIILEFSKDHLGAKALDLLTKENKLFLYELAKLLNKEQLPKTTTKFADCRYSTIEIFCGLQEMNFIMHEAMKKSISLPAHVREKYLQDVLQGQKDNWFDLRNAHYNKATFKQFYDSIINLKEKFNELKLINPQGFKVLDNLWQQWFEKFNSAYHTYLRYYKTHEHEIMYEAVMRNYEEDKRCLTGIYDALTKINLDDLNTSSDEESDDVHEPAHDSSLEEEKEKEEKILPYMIREISDRMMNLVYIELPDFNFLFEVLMCQENTIVYLGYQHADILTSVLINDCNFKKCLDIFFTEDIELPSKTWNYLLESPEKTYKRYLKKN